jgi:transposase-like protein
MVQVMRRFSDDFKAQVLASVASGMSVAEATRHYGLGKNAVYEWRNVAAAKADSVTVPKTELVRLQTRIDDLERLTGRLAVENDILKKVERNRLRNRSETK